MIEAVMNLQVKDVDVLGGFFTTDTTVFGKDFEELLTNSAKEITHYLSESSLSGNREIVLTLKNFKIIS